jgi:hypothetical protein
MSAAIACALRPPRVRSVGMNSMDETRPIDFQNSVNVNDVPMRVILVQ